MTSVNYPAGRRGWIPTETVLSSSVSQVQWETKGQIHVSCGVFQSMETQHVDDTWLGLKLFVSAIV